ncbi:type II secretion system F family protein [Arthrobacter sp. SDTb3-6]|uniref:type II secretion system F family protein n=1 Tax=Arthrobacter sp. SDTb3-6 TaxID=2713571 RepID=UPI00159D2194|nr:type II secretion system F family protein [Arthrobacter sp. SDTb3-6]NVM99300.1 type II secretion system F family protein [Arthrobacter sp. SDTb3-6]
MSPLALAAILFITLPLATLLFQVLAADTGTRKLVRQNLLVGPLAVKEKLARSRSVDLSEIAGRLAPKSYEAWLQRLLNRAGRPAKMPLARLLVIKPLLSFGVFLVGILFVASNPTKVTVLSLLGAVVLVYFAPDIMLDSRAKDRQEKITLELPNTLDQMLIAVQAGLGFESAMTRAASTGTGPLATELKRTLQDIQMGRTRADSYLALAQRTEVKDLKSFVRAIIQADKYGISIGNVLRAQADELRVKRRQRAEEKAMKIPVKILFPLIFTILPVLFIVILSPAIIGIMHIFSNSAF